MKPVHGAVLLTLLACKSDHPATGTPPTARPAAPTLTTSPAAPAPRAWVSVGHPGAGVQALLARPDGTAIAIGARKPKSPWSPRSDVAILDPGTNRWSAGPPLNVARNDLSAVVLRDGAVLVFGGSAEDDHDVDVVERLAPGAKTWSRVAPMPAAGRYVAAVVLPSGLVFAASGRHGYDCTGAAMLYDPAADRWRTLPPMPQPHTKATAVLDGAGQPVIVHGACDEDHDKQFGPDRYDLARSVWTSGAPTAETFGATASLGDGRTLVVGGLDVTEMKDIATAQILDASARTWRATTPAPTPREHGTALRIPDGKVMVLGGDPAVDLYDPTRESWAPGPPLPTAAWDMPAAVLRDGHVLVTAGFDAATETYRDDSWRY
jgi:hypothetical protein